MASDIAKTRYAPPLWVWYQVQTSGAETGATYCMPVPGGYVLKMLDWTESEREVDGKKNMVPDSCSSSGAFIPAGIQGARIDYPPPVDGE